MKVSLVLIAIFVGSLYVIAVFSDNKRPSFRRFELLVTGLRHKNYFLEGSTTCCADGPASNNCPTPCDRSPSIIINGMTPITLPAIGSNAPPDDGDFVYNNVWEDNDEPRVFFDFLNVSISIVRTSDGKSLGTGTLNKLRFAPNTDRQWLNFSLGININVNVHISYWCHDYTGMNCAYPCNEDDSSIECDYDTGANFCINGNPNPLDCSSTSDACIINDCKNGGICHMTNPGYKYCECGSGFEGKHCEIPICDSPCHPNNGRCVNGKCECDSGWGGINCSIAICDGWNMCLNKGECVIKLNDHICNCDPVKFSGQFCEKNCLVDCVFGICYYDGIKSFCICYEGYNGDSCKEITQTLPPIVEFGYVTKANQIAIIAGVVVALIVIAILAFGIGSYLRNNVTRSIKIVKRSDYILNTLKRDGLLDPVINATIVATSGKP